jgi:tetratricopeptide (TPR) repeat protein
VHVLSSPRVAAMNNVKAVLKIGTDEFYVTGVTTTTNTSAAGNTSSPSVTLTPFFSGVVLDVTPQIDDKGDILLHVQNKRPDDAVRQLQVALAFDPRQPAMAMLLARLQIERGGSGVDTLQRSLPYAAGNGDYHAFLAGALQRQGRHLEAAEQYGAALRANPHNGVWLMGLGISLQAEKRNGEALDAFRKARSSASMSPELQAFVDRKLLQLSQ